MTKGIFYTTRSIDGREGKNLVRHLAITKQHSGNVDFLTGTKSEASRKLIHQYGFIQPKQSINLYSDWYDTDAKNMSDWMEVYNNIDVKYLKDYDNLYLIGGLDLHRSNLGRFKNRVDVFPADRGQLKFESAGIHLVNILALLKAHRTYDIPLHELAYDPNEMSIDLFHDSVKPNGNYQLYHGYDIPLYNAKRLDSLQVWLNKESQRVSMFNFGITKDIDFTFGYTILKDSGRQHHKHTVNQIASEFDVSKVFIKDEYEGIDTHVGGDVYLEYIKRSKFTYMLPSYNPHCFSIYRFLESIYYDCLPLINAQCNINDVGASFGIVEELGILQSGRIPSEKDRIELLERLKDVMLDSTHSFV